MLYKAKPTTETDNSYMIGPHVVGLIIRLLDEVHPNQ